MPDTNCKGNRLFECRQDAWEIEGMPQTKQAVNNTPDDDLAILANHYKNAGKGDFQGELAKVFILDLGRSMQTVLRLWLRWGRPLLVGSNCSEHFNAFVTTTGLPLGRCDTTRLHARGPVGRS